MSPVIIGSLGQVLVLMNFKTDTVTPSISCRFISQPPRSISHLFTLTDVCAPSTALLTSRASSAKVVFLAKGISCNIRHLNWKELCLAFHSRESRHREMGSRVNHLWPVIPDQVTKAA